MRAPQRESPLSRFRVGGWLVHRDACRIARGGAEFHLRPMLIELLVLLAERKGRVVSKDEILDRVWGARFVSESALTRSMTELRQCLGDSADQPTIIENIPKRGYRLIADVEVVPAAPEGEPHPARPMIAVLPFENLTGDPDQEYFSDGMTEEVITQLGAAHPDDIGVIARTSVMPYKRMPTPLAQVAADLNVQYILEGSVRRQVSRVRVTAQLIRAADQTHLWANSYDDEIEEVLALQYRVAQAICEAIEPKIAQRVPRTEVRPRRVNPAAHDAYLRGLYNWNKFTPDAATQAVQDLQQSISLDPEHGPAHAALAHVFGMIGYWGFVPPAQVNPLARAEALKAIEIDDSLSIAHGALACVLCLHDWDYDTAEKELRRAIELNPSEATNHLWYAIYHAVFGEHAEMAVAEALTATRLDPCSPITALMVSSVDLLLDRFEQAREQAQATLGMFPGSLHAYRVLGVAYLGEGLFEHAIVALEKGVAIARESASVALLAQAYGRSGQVERARALIDELVQRSRQEYVLPTSMAWAYVGVEDWDSAFCWLETAFEQRCSFLLWLRAGPMFDPLRSDPRFADLLRRLRLPGHARATA